MPVIALCLGPPGILSVIGQIRITTGQAVQDSQFFDRVQDRVSFPESDHLFPEIQ